MLCERVVVNDGNQVSDENQHPLEEAILDFAASPMQVLLVLSACDTNMAELVGRVDKAVRYVVGDDFTVAAPASRIARHYPTTQSSGSLYGLIYSTEGKESRDDELIIHNRLESIHSDRHTYVVGDSHLVSDQYAQFDRRRFGSGHLLRDFMEYVGMPESQRKVVFVGDPWQMTRGNVTACALSEPKLHEYGVSVCKLQLPRSSAMEIENATVSNRRFLAGRLDTERFNLIDLKFDDDRCCRESPKNPLIPTLLRKLGDLPPGMGIVVAYSHDRVNLVTRYMRQKLLDFGEEIEPGDIVEAYNSFTLAEPMGAPSREDDNPAPINRRINNGIFGVVCSVTDGGKIVQTLKGRSEPVVVEFLRVRVKWCCEEGMQEADALCYKDFLYSTKPELSPDCPLAVRIHARERIANNCQSADGTAEIDISNDPHVNAAKLRFGYAMTLHRAQGRKFNTLVANLTAGGKLGDGETYFRWLYTAFSVDCEEGHFLNVPQHRPFLLTDWGFDSSRIGSVRPACMVGYDPQAPEPDDPIEFAIQQPELRNLFRHIRDRVTPSDINVTAITHHRYQEVYTFMSAQGADCTLQLLYNGKFYISRIMSRGSTDSSLAGRIRQILTPEPLFKNDLQKELYTELSWILERNGLRVVTVEHNSYEEVYYLKGRVGEARLKCSYNQHGTVTSGRLLQHSSREIRQQLQKVLTNEW